MQLAVWSAVVTSSNCNNCNYCEYYDKCRCVAAKATTTTRTLTFKRFVYFSFEQSYQGGTHLSTYFSYINCLLTGSIIKDLYNSVMSRSGAGNDQRGSRVPSLTDFALGRGSLPDEGVVDVQSPT